MTIIVQRFVCVPQNRAEQLSQWQQDLGKRMLLSRVSEAYGRMVLGPGLFQADCHPGNILVSDSGVVGTVLPSRCIVQHCHVRVRQAELAAMMTMMAIMYGGSSVDCNAAAGAPFVLRLHRLLAA